MTTELQPMQSMLTDSHAYFDIPTNHPKPVIEVSVQKPREMTPEMSNGLLSEVIAPLKERIASLVVGEPDSHALMHPEVRIHLPGRYLQFVGGQSSMGSTSDCTVRLLHCGWRDDADSTQEAIRTACLEWIKTFEI